MTDFHIWRLIWHNYMMFFCESYTILRTYLYYVEFWILKPQTNEIFVLQIWTTAAPTSPVWMGALVRTPPPTTTSARVLKVSPGLIAKWWTIRALRHLVSTGAPVSRPGGRLVANVDRDGLAQLVILVSRKWTAFLLC